MSYVCGNYLKEKIYKGKKYVEGNDPVDIIVVIKSNEDVEATEKFKRINREDNSENRLKLT